jgi:hypothetical protein
LLQAFGILSLSKYSSSIRIGLFFSACMVCTACFL